MLKNFFLFSISMLLLSSCYWNNSQAVTPEVAETSSVASQLSSTEPVAIDQTDQVDQKVTTPHLADKVGIVKKVIRAVTDDQFKKTSKEDISVPDNPTPEEKEDLRTAAYQQLDAKLITQKNGDTQTFDLQYNLYSYFKANVVLSVTQSKVADIQVLYTFQGTKMHLKRSDSNLELESEDGTFDPIDNDVADQMFEKADDFVSKYNSGQVMTRKALIQFGEESYVEVPDGWRISIK
jgi:hypothetical protein